MKYIGLILLFFSSAFAEDYFPVRRDAQIHALMCELAQNDVREDHLRMSPAGLVNDYVLEDYFKGTLESTYENDFRRNDALEDYKVKFGMYDFKKEEYPVDRILMGRYHNEKVYFTPNVSRKKHYV
jgi:hypothetical protein